MILQQREPSSSLATGGLTASVDLDISSDKRSDQSWPDRSLMVGAIAFVRAAPVSAAILGIAGCKATQTIRREEVFLNPLHHSPCAFGR